MKKSPRIKKEEYYDDEEATMEDDYENNIVEYSCNVCGDSFYAMEALMYHR